VEVESSNGGVESVNRSKTYNKKKRMAIVIVAMHVAGPLENILVALTEQVEVIDYASWLPWFGLWD
jgi:hypothetical protein